MNKDALAEAVMKAAELSTKKQAQTAVETVFDSIAKELGRGGEVSIAGFGSFSAVKRAARQGINPKTGEKIQIAASIKPKFKAGKALKEEVNK